MKVKQNLQKHTTSFYISAQVCGSKIKQKEIQTDRAPRSTNPYFFNNPGPHFNQADVQLVPNTFTVEQAIAVDWDAQYYLTLSENYADTHFR